MACLSLREFAADPVQCPSFIERRDLAALVAEVAVDGQGLLQRLGRARVISCQPPHGSELFEGVGLAKPADRSDLRVCVITYEDGTWELQILYTGLPRPAGTADAATFTGPAREALSQIRSITGDAALQAAVDLIHATLREADASVC